jgi:hypothetical protein
MVGQSTLIIYDSIEYFIPHFKNAGFQIFNTLRKIGFFQKVLRKFCFKIGIFKDYWFDINGKVDWANIKTVVIFASKHPSPINYIRRINPDIRIIYYYWNPVDKIGKDNYPESWCEKWSFDPEDCLKYGMHFNSTFYFKTIKLPKGEIEYDVVFLGVDKGRRNLLEEIQQSLKTQKFQTFFHIVDDNWNQRNYKGNNPPMNYALYLKLVAQSRAILDFVQIGQNGLTVRTMEALFFKKKLITNDRNIKQMDFYHPNNIFILGEDKQKDLNDFLNQPFCEVDQDVVDSYEVRNWMNAFFRLEESKQL